MIKKNHLTTTLIALKKKKVKKKRVLLLSEQEAGPLQDSLTRQEWVYSPKSKYIICLKGTHPEDGGNNIN